MPSTPSTAVDRKRPNDFWDHASYATNAALAARYCVHIAQILHWRDFVGPHKPGTLPPATGAARQHADRFALELTRWRRAYANVFPTSLYLDAQERTTWADEWNRTAERRGAPQIPGRGRGWWWVEGLGLVDTKRLLEGV